MADKINVTGLDKEEPQYVSGEETPVNTLNEFAVLAGQNMSNHSQALIGRGKFVQIGMQPVPALRTKQQVYRLAAWLVIMAEALDLPNEDTGAHTFDEVYNAVSNI